jgi:hypothetical protein
MLKEPKSLNDQIKFVGLHLWKKHVYSTFPPRGSTFITVAFCGAEIAGPFLLRIPFYNPEPSQYNIDSVNTPRLDPRPGDLQLYNMGQRMVLFPQTSFFPFGSESIYLFTSTPSHISPYLCQICPRLPVAQLKSIFTMSPVQRGNKLLIPALSGDELNDVRVTVKWQQRFSQQEVDYYVLTAKNSSQSASHLPCRSM